MPTTGTRLRHRGTEKRNPEGRWRSFDYEEILKRDKVSLDVFWLKDESLEDSDSLPDPNVFPTYLGGRLQPSCDYQISKQVSN